MSKSSGIEQLVIVLNSMSEGFDKLSTRQQLEVTLWLYRSIAHLKEIMVATEEDIKEIEDEYSN